MAIQVAGIPRRPRVMANVTAAMAVDELWPRQFARLAFARLFANINRLSDASPLDPRLRHTSTRRPLILSSHCGIDETRV